MIITAGRSRRAKAAGRRRGAAGRRAAVSHVRIDLVVRNLTHHFHLVFGTGWPVPGGTTRTVAGVERIRVVTRRPGPLRMSLAGTVGVPRRRAGVGCNPRVDCRVRPVTVPVTKLHAGSHDSGWLAWDNACSRHESESNRPARVGQKQQRLCAQSGDQHLLVR
jgi:hypothetical protein